MVITVDTSMRDERLELLRRKYAAGELTDEDQARLDLLTERLREICPRVDAADFENLERIAAEMSAK